LQRRSAIFATLLILALVAAGGWAGWPWLADLIAQGRAMLG